MYITWQDDKQNLHLGEVLETGTRFYTVSLISSEMKRKNYKRIPQGTKFLVNKETATELTNVQIKTTYGNR